MDKNIPLSELILLGCKFAPTQEFGHLWNKDKTRACAVGAAILGKTGGTPPPKLLVKGGWFEQDGDYAARVLGAQQDELTAIVVMNDHDRLTREQIAADLRNIGK